MSASAAPARSWSARRRRSPTTIEAWFEQTDVDGLNMPFAVSPGDFEDIADMLVPELTRRGRYKTAYAEGTLREKLFGAGPRAADAPHPAAQYRPKSRAQAAESTPSVSVMAEARLRRAHHPHVARRE